MPDRLGIGFSAHSSFVVVTDLQGAVAQLSVADEKFGPHISPGEHFTELFPIELRKDLQAAFEQSLAKNMLSDPVELPFGSNRTAEWRITFTPLVAASGQSSGVCVIAARIGGTNSQGREIPERSAKMPAPEPDVPQLHFRSFFESAPGLYLVLTPNDFRIVAASEAYLRGTMRKRDEIVGKRLFDVFPDNPADASADGVRNLRQSLERVKGSGEPDIMPIQRYPIVRALDQGGGWEERFWSPINSPVFGPDSTLEYIIHRVEDVTTFVRSRQQTGEGQSGEPQEDHCEAEVFVRTRHLRRLNEQLRESEQRFELIVQNVKDFAIFTFDNEGRINSWNPGAESVFGYSSAEALNRNVEVIYTEEDKTAGIPQRERSDANTYGCALNDRWLVKKDGTRIFVSGAIRPLRDKNGRLTGFAKVARDITRLKETEESLHELTGFVLRLQDHERRRIGRELHDSTAQALAALEMTLSLLEKRSDQLGERGAFLIQECVRLASQCSTEIRTISYLLHPPLLDELGLVSALDWYIKGFSQRSGIVVDLHISEDLGRLTDDAELALFRIVQECLTNIHRHSASLSAVIRLHRISGEIVLEISDQGVGMPHPDLQNLREHPIMGVGLAGMRERVRQLKGRLELVSDTSGTSVCVVLPGD